MNVGERIKYSEQMIKEYLGEDHRLCLKNTKRMLGQMDFSEKKITLSWKLLRFASDGFFDSVLFHEIAHGISYPHFQHEDITFKRWCAYFGAHSPRAVMFNAATIRR